MTSEEDSQTGLNYELLVEDALRSVVQSSLRIVENIGLPGETHFYITFITNCQGVEIDDALHAKHPDQMTIVIQHQYTDLWVADDHFGITLFFGGKPSPMVIPFQAVISFNDPSVGFGLQFNMADNGEVGRTLTGESDTDTNASQNAFESNENAGPTPKDTVQKSTTVTKPNEEKTADVVSLDTFRKGPSR